MTARFKVRPEEQAECEAAIHEFIEYIRLNEPGTRFYTSLRNSEDPLEYLHTFLFNDEAARDAHRTSEGVKRFTDRLYPRLEGGVSFTSYDEVATT